MNIIEALKSRKEIRRKSNGVIKYSSHTHLEERYAFSVSDILADDWEVVEKKIEITKSDLEIAVSKAKAKLILNYRASGNYNPWADAESIAKELGL